ncbi:glycosyltransferase 87 family protein [Kibdelosporangium persicum]|uniref:Polyprenol-phosphate-mannose alpha-mannosyltransferase n=1 Tax=Kibdelosporangium persicum TaxID=2698649 RepID=A0ABX2F1H0_9PSEU|nr:glycosyltransferase 87 family protein [Kibdelosporangium persicum]NRN64772.1 Polyprenol-phosphate-mannose alpha-mannosyltransferase [Kibdelosporangium persicum]
MSDVDERSGGAPVRATGQGPGKVTAAVEWFVGSWRAMWVVLAVPAAFIITGIAVWIAHGKMGVDSAVYRAGGIALLTGEPLYDKMTLLAEPWWAQLPFTYAPSAALFFVPMALFPTTVSWGFLSATSVLAMSLVIRITLDKVPRRPSWLEPRRATVWFSVLMLGLEPVWRTLFLGQINLILLVIVVVDVLVITTAGGRIGKWGGVLIGIAAAIKLTPLIFVAHLVLVGRRASAVRAFATFVGLQGLMFAISASDTWKYWTVTIVGDPARIGPVYWNGNQSLNGLINRITLLDPNSTKIALAIGALLAIPAMLLVRRFHRHGRAVTALLVSAFFGLLFSPVTWTHHYVWVVPLLIMLIARMPDPLPQGVARIARAAVAPLAVFVVFVSCILLWMRGGFGRELLWHWWEFIPGSAYMIVPVGAGIAIAIRVVRRRLRARAGDEQPRIAAGQSS